MKLIDTTTAIISFSLIIFPAVSTSAVINPPPAVGRPSYSPPNANANGNVNETDTAVSSNAVPAEGWTCTKLAYKVTFHTYWQDMPIFQPAAQRFMQAVQDGYDKTLEDFEPEWKVTNNQLTFDIEQKTGQAGNNASSAAVVATTKGLPDILVLAAIQCTTAWVKLWPTDFSSKKGVPDTKFDVMDTAQEGRPATGTFGRYSEPI